MIWVKFGHLIQIHHFKGGVTVNFKNNNTNHSVIFINSK